MPLVGPLNIEQPQITLNALPLVDFTGGLCLTRDGFLGPDNTSPDMCDVDVLPEGGICTRSRLTFGHWNDLPARICNMWQVQYYDQDATMMVSLEDGSVWEINCVTRQASQVAGVPVASNPVECCWRGVQANNVLYLYNGVDAPVAVDADGTVRPLAQTWNDWVEGQDPPVAGYEQPCCEAMVIAKKMVFFAGALWAADICYPPGTRPLSDLTKGQPLTASSDAEGTKSPEGLNEEKIERCNRIHFSFPIQGETGPEDWNSNDWLDLDEGADGECITALVPCGNQMYVFKEHSVHVVSFGEDGLPFTQKVLDKVGTPNCDSAICCEGNVYFWDTRSGLNVITRDGSYQNLFDKLRPLLDECPPQGEGVWSDVKVGFCEGKVMVSMPWRGEVYVLDTTQASTPWVKYNWCVDGFHNFCPSGEQGQCVMASDITNSMVKWDQKQDTGHDWYTPAFCKPVRPYYCTNWFGASSSAVSNPFTEKEWCGLDLIGYGDGLTLEYYADQDERKYTGVSGVTWSECEFGSPICLGDYCFPDGPRMHMSGDDMFEDPLFQYPEGTPCLVPADIDDLDAKSKGTCIQLPCDSCSLQICFRGETSGEFCICTIQLQFREGPNPKQEYERTN